MKYIKLFKKHSDYEQYISGDTVALPNVSHCIQEAEVHYNPYVRNYANEYLTFVAKENGTFTFTPQNNNVISYSTDDGSTWTVGNSVEVSSGDKVMWKGTMTPASPQGIGSFSVSTNSFDVQGNVMSLLYGDDFKNQTDLSGKTYAFYNLFRNTKVVNAKNLSLLATTLANNCYQYMFSTCTSLVTTPELPATTLATSCYYGMFYGCTSLTTAPELPATTLAEYCYQSMFSNCTSLTTAPELPATILRLQCYQYMFKACTSLATAPELPATKLAIYCYSYMFQGCTSLTVAPELPATTLTNHCYNYMFQGCTSLTAAPELPTMTLASSCYSGMFQGCTSLTVAPELPATEMSISCYYCYSYMFQGCTSLTTAPELPATKLVTNCYYGMFSGCTNLNSITCLATNISESDCTTNWVNGVSASGTFTKAASMSSWTTGNNGIPNGWTIETASE